MGMSVSSRLIILQLLPGSIATVILESHSYLSEGRQYDLWTFCPSGACANAG